MPDPLDRAREAITALRSIDLEGIVTLWRCPTCGRTEPNTSQSARYCAATRACSKPRRGGTFALTPMERVDYVPVSEVPDA